MPLFSVIIPLYNKAGYIKNTLAALHAQTFTDYEIIVINDGSTDNSDAIFKTLKHEKLTYLTTVNRGVSAARNTGIATAKGTLIAFLDADDVWKPNHLETLYNLYRQYPGAGMYVSRYYIKNPGSNTLQKTVLNNIPNGFTGVVPDFFNSSLTHRLAWTSALAIPKIVFNNVGFFNESLTNSEDTEMWIRIALKYPVALSNKFTAIYNFEIPNSLSKRKITACKIMDFSPFVTFEQQNSSLKAYMDMYRTEYALKFKTQGDTLTAATLMRAVNPKNISALKTFLLKLPVAVLIALLYSKRWLYKKGILQYR